MNLSGAALAGAMHGAGINMRYLGLVADLRAQGMGNVLRQPGSPLGRSALERARAAFLDHADPDGRVPVTFEMVALTGWA